jgi:predicted small integral membrane protein
MGQSPSSDVTAKRPQFDPQDPNASMKQGFLKYVKSRMDQLNISSYAYSLAHEAWKVLFCESSGFLWIAGSCSIYLASTQCFLVL